jgi:hypothetical protein
MDADRTQLEFFGPDITTPLAKRCVGSPKASR